MVGRKESEFRKFRTKAPSGSQMRESLSKQLPAIKAKVAERTAKHFGRPSHYSEEKAQKLFELMAQGNSLTEACDAVGTSRASVYGWAEKHPDFAASLARAREALAEHAFSEAYAIPKRLLSLYENDPDLKLDPARVQAARLATDTLKWYAERLAPKTFGERKPEPVAVNIDNRSVTVNSRDLTQEQRDALRGALMAAKALPPVIDNE